MSSSPPDPLPRELRIVAALDLLVTEIAGIRSELVELQKQTGNAYSPTTPILNRANAVIEALKKDVQVTDEAILADTDRLFDEEYVPLPEDEDDAPEVFTIGMPARRLPSDGST